MVTVQISFYVFYLGLPSSSLILRYNISIRANFQPKGHVPSYRAFRSFLIRSVEFPTTLYAGLRVAVKVVKPVVNRSRKHPKRDVRDDKMSRNVKTVRYGD